MNTFLDKLIATLLQVYEELLGQILILLSQYTDHL